MSRNVDVELSTFGVKENLNLEQKNDESKILNNNKNIANKHKSTFDDEDSIKAQHQRTSYMLAGDLGVVGDCFGLFGKAIPKNNKNCQYVIRENGIMIVAEYNKEVYKEIAEIVRRYPDLQRKVVMINCDYFKAFQIIENRQKSIRIGYIDLDLYWSAHTLVNKENFIEKLYYMVTSNIVADRFCISITHSYRSGRAPKEQEYYAESRIHEVLGHEIMTTLPGIELVKDYRNPFIEKYGAPNDPDPKNHGGYMMIVSYILDKSRWVKRIN